MPFASTELNGGAFECSVLLKYLLMECRLGRVLDRTGIQEVMGSILWSGNILPWRLVMKSFLRQCRTPEREVRGSRPTAAVLCP